MLLVVTPNMFLVVQPPIVSNELEPLKTPTRKVGPSRSGSSSTATG